MNQTKQPYAAPELKEWGAVAEITQISKCIGEECFEGSVVYEIR